MIFNLIKIIKLKIGSESLVKLQESPSLFVVITVKYQLRYVLIASIYFQDALFAVAVSHALRDFPESDKVMLQAVSDALSVTLESLFRSLLKKLPKVSMQLSFLG